MKSKLTKQVIATHKGILFCIWFLRFYNYFSAGI